MLLIRAFSYLCFGIAALCAVAFLSGGDPFMAMLVAASLVSGGIFAGFDRALVYLGDIRDSLRPVTQLAEAPEDERAVAPPPASIEDIDKAITRLRAQ